MTPNEEPEWYVMNALYGSALRSQTMLASLDIESFVPMEYRPLVVKGKKVVEKLQPILQNLIFVRSTYAELRELNQSCGNLHFRYTKTSGEAKNLPMKVASEPMQRFIDFIEGRYMDVEYIDPESFELKSGERVRITDGAFKGKEGTLVKVSGKQRKQIVVAIEGVVAVKIKTTRPWAIVERI